LLETRVRVATWNLWGRYGPWEARAPAIVETLRQVGADVVGLQEVWEDDAHSQARELADALGYPSVVYAPNLERDGARSGNAVLARWPLLRTEVRALPREGGGARDDEGEERLALFAEIDGPRGAIQLFCAHLSWRDDHGAVRQQQVRAIAAFVRETRPRSFPAVLVGDLNADPASDELRMLTGLAAVPVPGVVLHDAWHVAGDRTPGWTVSNANPFSAANLDRDRRIDYVLVGQPKLGGAGHARHVEVFGHRPVGGTWPSDHFGVVAELRY
jgi:endonuclease/exonuclease/phosphatase family metal-dependent hydrolase